MKNRFKQLLVAVVFILDVAQMGSSSFNSPLNLPSHNSPSSKGNEFVLAFWSNGGESTIPRPTIALFVTTDDPDPVSFTVDAPSTNIFSEMTYTAIAGRTTTITLPTNDASPTVQTQDIRVFQSTERNKGIHVKAEDGKKISVYGLNDDDVSTDAFLALPCVDYGEFAPDHYSYYVFSADIEGTTETLSSRFMIIPCENDTEVNLIPSQNLEIAADISSIGFAAQVGPGIGTTSFRISLDSLETAMFQSPDDLTGTILESNKPITVLVGHECGQVPEEVTACDVLVEQVPPHITYGTRFLTAPLQFRESGERYRIGSVSNSPNEVTVTCTSEDGTPQTRLTQTLTRGEYAEFDTSGNSDVGPTDSYRREFCCIESSLPATVMQYTKGHSVDEIFDQGDPSMLYIPPVTQYLNDFTLTTDLQVRTGYMSYTITSQFFTDPLVDGRKLLVNGITFNPESGYLPIYCPDTSTFAVCGYDIVQIKTASSVSQGDHSISYDQAGAGFFPFVYGLDIELSFEYPAGFGLEPLGLPRIEIPDLIFLESSGLVEIPIRRSGGDLSLPSVITVSFGENGNATAGSDFEVSSFFSHRLRYSANEVKPRNTDTLRITIIDDDITEPDESFEIYVVEVQRNAYVPKLVGTITIVDDDGDREVFFEDVVYNIQETQSFVELVVRTNIMRLQNGNVLFYTEDGTASSLGDDPDYESIPRANASSVIFPIGKDPLSTVIRIFIFDDDIVEEVEYFYVRLIRNPLADISVPFFNITEPMIRVNIADDDFVLIGFESTHYNASEMDEFVSIAVKVFSGRLAGNINATLQLEIQLGLPTAPIDDFNETATQTVILSPGVVSLPVEVSIPNQVKEFRVRLSSQVNYLRVQNTRSTATVNVTPNNVTCFINDDCSDNSSMTTMTERQCCVESKHAKGFKIIHGDDTCFTCIVFGFFNDNFSGLEQNESYAVQVGFLKSGPGLEAQLEFEVMINLGTASNSDITLHNSRVLLSTQNENSEEISFTFKVDNLAQEEDETLQLQLSVTSQVGYDFSSMVNAFIVDTLSLVIQDNDDVELEFTSIIFESDESNLFIPITMEFSKQLASPVTIRVTPKTLQEHRLSGRPDPRDNDTSDRPSNILPPTEADFADFDNSLIILSLPGSQILHSEVRVPINDDVIDESHEQDFVVTFEVIVTKNIVLPQNWDVIARIIDNDEIRISFNDYIYTFSESGGEFSDNHYQLFLTKEFQIGVLTEQTFEVVLTVNTNFSTTSRTQAATLLGHGDHADYNISKEQPNVNMVVLTFPQDQQTIPFDIYIVDDLLAEASEAFQVVISPKENTPSFSTPQSNIIVIITDNDVVTFGVEMNYVLNEGDEDVQICGMVRSPREDVAIIAEILLNVTVIPETGDERDIRRSNNHSQILINNQTRRGCFLLTVVEDGRVESTETLSIEFRINSTFPMIQFELDPSKTTITIPTNADGIIGFTETALQVNESDVPVTLDIEVLFGKLNGTVLICLSVVFTSSDLGPYSSEAVLQQDVYFLIDATRSIGILTFCQEMYVLEVISAALNAREGDDDLCSSTRIGAYFYPKSKTSSSNSLVYFPIGSFDCTNTVEEFHRLMQAFTTESDLEEQDSVLFNLQRNSLRGSVTLPSKAINFLAEEIEADVKRYRDRHRIAVILADGLPDESPTVVEEAVKNLVNKGGNKFTLIAAGIANDLASGFNHSQFEDHVKQLANNNMHNSYVTPRRSTQNLGLLVGSALLDIFEKNGVLFQSQLVTNELQELLIDNSPGMYYCDCNVIPFRPGTPDQCQNTCPSNVYNENRDSCKVPPIHLCLEIESQSVLHEFGPDKVLQNVTIPILDDEMYEVRQKLIVSLSVVNVTSPDDRVAVEPSRSTVTILDNDFLMFKFGSDNYMTGENESSINIVIDLVSGDTNLDVFAIVSTRNGFASANDYVPLTKREVMFQRSVNNYTLRASFGIGINDDIFTEFNEYFTVKIIEIKLRRLGNDNNVVLSEEELNRIYFDDETNVTIIDDDAVTIGFLGTMSLDRRVNEGPNSTITFNIGIMPPEGQLGIQLSILFQTFDNDTTVRRDYKPETQTLVFMSATESMSQSIDVVIIDDNDVEGMETFFVQLVPSPNFEIPPHVTISTERPSVTIIDDDDVTIELEPSSAQVVVRNKNRTQNAPRILRDLLVNKPNHLLKYNIGNNFCLENATAELNFTIYCNPIDSLEATNSTWWIFDRDNMEEVEIVNKRDILCIEYSDDFHSSLLFGPATLLDLAQYSNTSGENISITIGCRLTNEFGSDNETIEITQCAPDACQDGGTNNCNQKCSRDERGIHKCKCADGYLLDTDNETCIATRCSDLDDPDNGMVEFSRTYQSVANYSCEPTMYILIPYDQKQRTCLSNGSWNGTTPTCRKCEGGAATDGMSCKDICNSSNHNCTTSATCESTENDSYICTCSFFYQFQSDGVSCKVHTAVIAVSVTVGIILLFIVIVLATAGIRKYNNKLIQKQIALKEQALLDAKADSQGTGLTQFTVQLSFDALKEIHKELLIYSANLRILDTIGQGEFGVVYKGHLLKDLGQTVTGVVAIKTLKGFVDETLVEGLLNECVKMQKFDHPNVLNLTGVCLDGGPTPFLVMPFMANGSLKSYLKKERSNLVISTESDSIETLEKMAVTLKRLLDMCHQVAKGMEYIAGMRFIHRDLATRNCMIDINYVIKVADFGLSEQMESKNYFRQDRAGAMKLPFKWLALESLTDSIFSEKTDVWAFGVTCWEIFSGGKAPYSSINPAELSQRLESGYRLEKPTNEACSDQVYSVMMECWNADPDERPSFSELVEIISLYLESMAGYLHIGAFNKPSTDSEMSGQIPGSDSEACDTNLTADSHAEATDNGNVHVIDDEVETKLTAGIAETAV